MLQRRELTQVVADAELAERMLATARQHLVSAETLADTDPYLAYAALHDAVRKALAALLQVQGLRATTTGGHLAVQHAARAQFGASLGAILRPIDRIRTTRHESEYPTPTTWIDEESVRDDLPAAAAVVDATGKVLSHLSPFIP
ncbi:HEPN domain-containing protein [Sphaerimonospora thailandensis]|nr:HEPN domain-containing protein [Sphaerimonospora thailandensis]